MYRDNHSLMAFLRYYKYMSKTFKTYLDKAGKVRYFKGIIVFDFSLFLVGEVK